MKKILLPVACALCAVALNAEDTTTQVTIASGFNVDVVAEDPYEEDTDKTKFPHMDGHHSMLLVNDDIEITRGIPEDGKITSEESGYVYQMGDFQSNNCLYLPRKGETGTLVFAEPVTATNLGLLICATDGAEGCNPHPSYSAVINYEDGTTDTTEARSVADWGCGHAKAFKMGQRFRGDGQPVENCPLVMAEDILTVKADVKIKSITLTCESEPTMASWGEYCYGSFNFLAVTAITKTSGIDSVTAESAEIEAIYNVEGIKLNELGNGLNIVKYTNGDVRKVYVNK